MIPQTNYFKWLAKQIDDGNEHHSLEHFNRCLENLFCEEFYWLIPLDGNRAKDGLNLRYKYCRDELGEDNNDILNHLDGKCSVLEMLVALCARAEEEIMNDPEIGDRTGMWFWRIMNNLGLDQLDDEHYNDVIFYHILDTFLNREFGTDGKGGPFYIPGTDADLKTIEFWYQFNMYLTAFFVDELV